MLTGLRWFAYLTACLIKAARRCKKKLPLLLLHPRFYSLDRLCLWYTVSWTRLACLLLLIYGTDVLNNAVSVLPFSVSHSFLPRSACDRVHVRGARYTEHQRTDQTTDRLAACQIHQGNKRWALNTSARTHNAGGHGGPALTDIHTLYTQLLWLTVYWIHHRDYCKVWACKAHACLFLCSV